MSVCRRENGGIWRTFRRRRFCIAITIFLGGSAPSHLRHPAITNISQAIDVDDDHESFQGGQAKRPSSDPFMLHRMGNGASESAFDAEESALMPIPGNNSNAFL